MFEDFEEEDDEYDNFFFESVRRYQTLQMFNLENTPYHILQVDNASICVSSNLNNGKKSELLKLGLPEKLNLTPEEEGRSKGNDFKVISGVYTENIVWKIDKLENIGKILTSEIDVEGLRLYNLQQYSGNQSKNEKLKAVVWKKSNITTLKKTNNIICCKCNHKPIIVINADVDQISKKISHPFYLIDFQSIKEDSCSLNNIQCQALSNNLISILNSSSGNLVLHDLRTYDCFVPLPEFQGKHNEESWSVSGNNFQNDFSNYFGIISNRQSFCVYDIRANSLVFKNTGSDAAREYCGNLKLLFNRKADRFSISGTSSVVKVFSHDGFNYKQIFVHNGHCPNNSSLNLVTDHIWLSAGCKEYIISLCDNKTLNCWEFNPDF